MAIAASAIVACPALFADQTLYYWNNTNGGSWASAGNWVMADGSAATAYPKVAGDVAVFNGLAAFNTVYVNESDVIDVDELRIDDGCMRLSFRNSATLHFHADRLVRSESAVLYLVTDGAYNHASPPAGVTIGNRADVLFNGGFLPGAVVCKDGGGWGALRSATILEDGTLKYGSLDSLNMAYGVGGDSTWNKDVTLFYGNFGDGRHISFNKECVLTVPCGQIGPLSNYSHVGNPTSAYQGTIDTVSAPLYFWPLNTTCFRAKVVTPLFVQSGHYTTLYCDDHSSETNDYVVSAGTFQLGSLPEPGAETLSVTNVCKLGTGSLVVSWAGTLNVAADNALSDVAMLRMTSFRGERETWGHIVMSTNSTVMTFALDDKLLRRGTYGASGSGAKFVDDIRFSGPGVLTVKKGGGFWTSLR
jgi:hypothetical protein